MFSFSECYNIFKLPTPTAVCYSIDKQRLECHNVSVNLSINVSIDNDTSRFSRSSERDGNKWILVSKTCKLNAIWFPVTRLIKLLILSSEPFECNSIGCVK